MGAPESKVVRLADAAGMPIEGDGAQGVTGYPLLELDDGTGAFDVRGVRIAPGGVSADHLHAWEQANYVLEGDGSVFLGDERHDIAAGDFVYVAPNIRHVFHAGDAGLVLLATRGGR